MQLLSDGNRRTESKTKKKVPEIVDTGFQKESTPKGEGQHMKVEIEELEYLCWVQMIWMWISPGSSGSSEPTPEERLRKGGAQGGSGSSPPNWIPNSGVQG